MHFAFVVLSFVVGAVIAWMTRPKQSQPPRPQLRQVEEEEEREKHLQLQQLQQQSAQEPEDSEETPLYAPYVVRRPSTEQPASPDFVGAPLLLPSSSAPPSPRSGTVAWEPDEARPDCNFCRTKFSFARRRHHCRSCGLLVCGSCSRDRQRVAGHGLLPVRVCDGCIISSIASKKGEAMPISSIKAFALQNSKTNRMEAEQLARQHLLLPGHPSAATPQTEEEELLRMSRALRAELTSSAAPPPPPESEMRTADEEGEDEDDESAEEEQRAPVKRSLFDEVPSHYYWRERLREAEAVAARGEESGVVLQQGDMSVARISAMPVDAFMLTALLPAGLDLDKIAATLGSVEQRLVWDTDLQRAGTEELERFEATARLERHVTKAIGPVSARSFVVLVVRCDDAATGRVRLLQTGVNEPARHYGGCTAGQQLPQLLSFERRGDRLLMRQTVHLQLGGWVPMGVVLSGMPALLVSSCERWLAWVTQTCAQDRTAIE